MLGVLIFAAMLVTAFGDGQHDVWQYLHNLEERLKVCESDVKQTKQVTESMLQNMDERVRKLDVPVIAFTASSSVSRSINVGQKLQFDVVQINEGNGYNAATGVFTCPQTGWYLFSASILSQNARKAVYHVMVGGATASMQYSDGPGGATASSSAPVVVYCVSGTEVWLEAQQETCHYFASSWGNSVFTGILINQRV